MQKLTSQEIDIFFAELKDKKVMPKSRKKIKSDDDLPCLASKTRREIYNVLKSAFDTAKRWKLIEQDLVTCACPAPNTKEILSWDQDGIRKALDSIQDKQIHLTVHMAFACTMRIGEVAGLQWEHIDLDNDKIYVRQILQRVTKESLRLLNPDSIFFMFPEQISNAKSVLVLKEPKTKSSIRDLHIPKALKAEILACKEQQEKDKLYCAHSQDVAKREMNHNFEKYFYGEENNVEIASMPEGEKVQALLDECNKNPELAKQLLKALTAK